MNQLDNQVGVSQAVLIAHLEHIRNSTAYMAMTAAGSVMGTTSSTAIRINNAMTYAFNGIAKTRAATEVLLTTAQNIAGSTVAVQEMIVVLALDGSGNATLINGALATGTGNALQPEQTAIVNSSGVQLTPVAKLRIATTTSTGASFVGGTTTLGAASFAFTFQDYLGGGYLASFLGTE